MLIFVNFPALVDGTFYGKNLQRTENTPDVLDAGDRGAERRGDHQTRILEEPGADFASYTWGNTVDPITPGLTDRPYVARELIPYGTAGSADLLNAIDRRLQEGIADPHGLAALWRRMGIGDVVARNDIQYERYDLVPPRRSSPACSRKRPASASPRRTVRRSTVPAPVGYERRDRVGEPADRQHARARRRVSGRKPDARSCAGESTDARADGQRRR